MAAITTLQEPEERARDEAVADSFLGDDTLPPTATDQVAAEIYTQPVCCTDSRKIRGNLAAVSRLSRAVSRCLALSRA
eukprot:5065354-Prymnesium_polylepis.1